MPVSTPQSTFSDGGLFSVSESLQTLNEFNAEEILVVKQEGDAASSSSDYYSLESSPTSSSNYLEAATPEFYSNPMMFDPAVGYFQQNHHSFKGKLIQLCM